MSTIVIVVQKHVNLFVFIHNSKFKTVVQKPERLVKCDFRYTQMLFQLLIAELTCQKCNIGVCCVRHYIAVSIPAYINENK